MGTKLFFLALAGACGTLARYGLAGGIHRLTGAGFPWGTLAANLTGCFLAGLVWALFERNWPAMSQVRTIILVGFMGAFTTFSAYILETGHLVRSSQYLYAAANLCLENVLGLALFFVGMALGSIK